MKASLVVATKTGEEAWRQLPAATALAEKLGLSLHLVHVIPPFQSSVLGRLSGRGLDGADTEEIGDLRKAAAINQLEELASESSTRIPTTSIVHSGRLGEGIAYGAREGDADYIFCTPHLGKARKDWEGLASIMSIIEAAPVPVFVNSETHSLDASKDLLSIQILDDLSAEGNAAVAAGYDLARRLGTENVTHTHIHSLTEAEFIEALALYAAAQAGTLLGGSGPSGAYAKTREMAAIELEARVPADFAKKVGAKRQCLTRKEGTSLKATLQSAMSETHADITVFGQHRTLHTSPFAIGRVPLAAMVATDRTVMIVPTQLTESET